MLIFRVMLLLWFYLGCPVYNKFIHNPQDMEISVNGKLGLIPSLTYNQRNETMWLLTRDSEANLVKEWPIEASCRASSAEVLSLRNRSILRFRPLLFIIATAAVCLGICAVLFHPHKVTEFAVSIRRCL